MINYMSEGGGVKPAKAYLEVSLNISVTGTQQQPGTLVGTGYLQTTFEIGNDQSSTYVFAGSVHSRTNRPSLRIQVSLIRNW